MPPLPKTCPQCHGFDDYCADVAICETCKGSGKVFIVSDIVKPPPHPFYGDSYCRGIDPFHVDAAPDEFKERSVWRRGERKGGWFLLDAYDQEIGWIPDGTTYPVADSTVSEHNELRSEKQ